MTRHGIGFWVATALTSLTFAEAGIKLENGDFEAPGNGGWHIPERWAIVPGAGRNGSKALVWDNKDPKHYTFPHYQMTAEPGARFRFRGWVKAERGTLADLSPHVDIDWSDAQGT